MDWSTSALMNNSPLARRLPGQRTPPDPTLAQPNAADITYGWHTSEHSSSSESQDESDSEENRRAEGSTRQQEAAAALKQRRRERREARRRTSASNSASSSEGSIISFNSATGENEEPNEGAREGDDIGGSKFEREEPPSAPINDHNHDSESFICRICFDGSGSQDEGGETLGKLIAPCRCRGTMKFVHQACLTRWRAASMRASSFMACDQCGSPYKFRKSKFVGLATNRLLILAVSCLLFTTLIWSVGFGAETIVRRWDDSDKSVQSKGTSRGGGYWQSLFGDDDDGHSGSFYDADSDVYTYGYGYVSTFYLEPLSYFRLIKAAVKHVGSGRATRAVKDLVKGESYPSARVQTEEREMGWLKSLLDDWKYGRGGLWEGQRPETDDGEDKLNSESYIKERYDAKTASVLKAGEKPKRESKSGSKSSKDEQSSTEEVSGWWDRITMQFSLGFSLVGIFSFLNLLLGVSLWGPFQLGNFGLGHSFARLTGGGRRRGGGGGGGGGGDGGTITSVVLLFLVIIGILRALMAVISVTTYLSKRLLTRVEDYIVEYSGEEVDQEQTTPTAMPAAVNRDVQRRWWRRV